VAGVRPDERYFGISELNASQVGRRAQARTDVRPQQIIQSSFVIGARAELIMLTFSESMSRRQPSAAGCQKAASHQAHVSGPNNRYPHQAASAT